MVKRAATRVIEALGTATQDGGAADRLRDAGVSPDLADQAGALVPPAAPAVVEVVYPQYGGLTTDRASVMAVVQQTWVSGASTNSRTVTADVRLRRSGGAWSVTGLLVAEPTEVPSQTLTGTAGELAGLAGVELPDAALADLAGDEVDDLVPDLLIQLASSFSFSVSVFRTGHPKRVFGSNRTSNHDRGRAVDIWAIDGRPVVTMATDDPTLLSFLEAARDLGSDEIGAPIDPDGPGGVHFTDDVHRDHVHIGFEP